MRRLALVVWILLFVSSVARGQLLRPSWVEIPATREVRYKGVLGDLEARMPANHQYRDSRIGTWAHETSHGLHSILRNRFARDGYNDHNCLFVPDKYCAIVQDPAGVTLRSIAQAVPKSWRGMSYRLYLQQQAGQWNSDPTYVLDEWVSYSNGTAAVFENKEKNPPYSDPLQMIEFTGYAITFVTVANQKPDENVKQLNAFICWYSVRTVNLLKAVGSWYDVSKANQHLQTIQASSDGEQIRATAKRLLGNDWARRVLGR